MNNSLGTIFKITTFGESHGKAIGCIIEGCPSGVIIKKKHIQKELNKRKPGKNKFVTQRKEKDKVKILSGIHNNRTTGTPMGLLVENKEYKSEDYEEIKEIFRPGHADYTYLYKYQIRDHRGGGRASARTTIAIVIAGSIAKKILKDFFDTKLICEIISVGKKTIKKTNNIGTKYSKEIKKETIKKKNIRSKKNEINNNKTRKNKISEIIRTKTKENKIINKEIENIVKDNDSVGCVLRLTIEGIIPGIGEPIFDKINSTLSKEIMNINAVKAVEIGEGIKSSKSKGSKNNDPFFKEGIIENRSGGIIGGITTGKNININIYIKPTSSIFKKQKTININKKEKIISIKGRHDPCVGLRARPIIESISAIIILDLILRQKAKTFY